MKRKVWLLVLLLLIILSQFTILSTFFHSFQVAGSAQNRSIVEVSKLSYVFGWASISIQGPSSRYPVTLQFSNGTRVNLTSDFSFKMQLPRTGDCLCSVGTGLFGTNTSIDQSSPIAAAVLSNVSSFEISTLPKSGVPIDQGTVEYYWFTVEGYALINIRGYGVSY